MVSMEDVKNDHLECNTLGLGLSMFLVLGGLYGIDLEEVVVLFSTVFFQISVLSYYISVFILLISLILS